jgi:hypothetical protein
VSKKILPQPGIGSGSRKFETIRKISITKSFAELMHNDRIHENAQKIFAL